MQSSEKVNLKLLVNCNILLQLVTFYMEYKENNRRVIE